MAVVQKKNILFHYTSMFLYIARISIVSENYLSRLQMNRLSAITQKEMRNLKRVAATELIH